MERQPLACLRLGAGVGGFHALCRASLWRRTFLQIAQMRDGQIRFFALCSILAGLLMLVWA